MMKFRCYKNNGERGPQVWLDLRKGAVAQRLLNCLQDKDLAKSGRFNISSLVKIDSGEFPVDGLANLGYTKSEIDAAIQGRLDSIVMEGEELEALRSLLHSGAWRGANGGPDSNQSREATLRRDWNNTVTSPRKSLGSANLTRDQKMEKSRGMGATSCGDILTAHSWERTDGDKGTDIFTHGKLRGHSVHVSIPSEAWEHRKGQKLIGASERGDEPQVAAATLNSHLMTQFHRR